MTPTYESVALAVEARWSEATYSVSKPPRTKQRKKLPAHEAYISTDDKIGTPSHYFAVANGDTPGEAMQLAFDELVRISTEKEKK